MNPGNNVPFSDELERWLRSRQPKTLLSLDRVFAEKSFAVTFAMLMAFSALPIPTGGLSHAFGLVAALIALQILVGRRSLWVPQRWQDLKINRGMQERLIPALIRLIRWLEKYSRPRFTHILRSALTIRLYGLAVFVFSASVAVSPPFSGLDTLPAMGVVLMSLSVILEDFFLFVFGLIVGTAGVILMIFIGAAAFELFTRLF